MRDEKLGKWGRLTSRRLGKDKKAASPAISMVIITAVTIVLVTVTASYAYQVLDFQQGASEFEAAKKSFLAFDDAVRDVAWDQGGSRSARFALNRGSLSVVLNTSLVLNVAEYPSANYSTSTGYVRYNLSTTYVTFGDGYESFILGDNRTIVSASAESFGRGLVKQEFGKASIILSYRVRAFREGPTTLVSSTQVSYVDVLIVRINATNTASYIGDFDLVARNTGLTTVTRGPYNVISGNICSISVSLGAATSSLIVNLDPGKVVFNFVIADIRIST